MIDFKVLKTKNLLGESSFYLKKTNEVVWLDLLNTQIFFYSLSKKIITKKKLRLKKPLGNIYPLKNGLFLISCKSGIYKYSRENHTLIQLEDIRILKNKKLVIYNDGTISKNKIWISLSHVDEKKPLGYFGYLDKFYKFHVIDKNFIVSNGPAIDEKNNIAYFSDTFGKKIYKYNLRKNTKELLFKFTKKNGYPDGLALDKSNGLWVAHWNEGKISRIKTKEKKLDFSINLPALNITSITFCGKKMNYLFVTSAKIDTSKEKIEEYPDSGSCFIIKTNFIGQNIPISNLV